MSQIWLMGLLATVSLKELQEVHEQRDYYKLARLFGGRIEFLKEHSCAKFNDTVAAEAFHTALRPNRFPGASLVSYASADGKTIYWYHEELKRPKMEVLVSENMHDKFVTKEMLEFRPPLDNGSLNTHITIGDS